MEPSAARALETLFDRRKDLTPCREALERAFHLLVKSQRDGGRILVCGNGGSAADSIHIVGELLKAFEHPRLLPESLKAKLRGAHSEWGAVLAEGLQIPIRAVSLVSEAALITAVANDSHADMIFAQQVLGHGSAGDVLLCISTSGKSKNVVFAALTAKAIGMDVIGLTGPKSSDLTDIADCVINAPGSSTAEIQEAHLPIYHTLCLMLEIELMA